MSIQQTRDEIKQRSGQPREVVFLCNFCSPYTFIITVPFGCFIKMNEGVNVEIVEERLERFDIPLTDIWCPRCGCSSGLKKKLV